MKGRERECGEERGGKKEESDSFRWRFSNLKGIQIILVLVKMQVTDSVGLGGLRWCVFNMLPGDADAAGPGTQEGASARISPQAGLLPHIPP